MKIKKKYYKYIVVGGFIIFSSIILFKPKEKVPIKPHYRYGNIEEMYDEPHSRTMENKNSIQKENHRFGYAKEKEIAREEKYFDRRLFLEDKTVLKNTDDEKFKLIKTEYIPKDESLYVYFDIWNLSDNRMKKITVDVYNNSNLKIGSLTKYQNSLAKHQTRFAYRIPLMKGYIGKDISKIEIKAEKIQKDYLPWNNYYT